MSKLMRFGRKIALPSTLQIRHELLVLIRDEEHREASKAAVAAAVSAAVDPAFCIPPS